MPAKKKTATKKARGHRVQNEVPNYRLLTLEEYESLDASAKADFIRLLHEREQWQRGSPLDTVFERAPELITQGFEMYSSHFAQRAQLTRKSLWAHIGVLAGGTGAMLWLGLARVLDGATIVALLGPLYTYVLVNLRYLTGWKIVGDSNGQS